jgi:hypothetical protein
MGPNLVKTTQASRQKNRAAITAVKTKNQRNARKIGANQRPPGPIQEVVAAEVTRRILPSNPPIPESTLLGKLKRSKCEMRRSDSQPKMHGMEPRMKHRLNTERGRGLKIGLSRSFALPVGRGSRRAVTHPCSTRVPSVAAKFEFVGGGPRPHGSRGWPRRLRRSHRCLNPPCSPAL